MLIRHSQHSSNNRRSRGGPDETTSEFPQRKTTPGPDDVYDPDFSSRTNSPGPDSYDGDGYVGSMFLG